MLDIELPEGKRYQREITREQFEQLVQPILDRTIAPCKQALKDANLKPEQIDEAVLVGGSTRIPRVRTLVQDLFRRVPHTDLNPDEVVALGAAVQANILGGGSEATKEMLLLDVTPLSLGIEVAGGVTDKIILRNSTIPASATQFYTTQVDGQANVAIHVLQGERELGRVRHRPHRQDDAVGRFHEDDRHEGPELGAGLLPGRRRGAMLRGQHVQLE